MARDTGHGVRREELPRARLDREGLREAFALFARIRPELPRFAAAMAALFVGGLLSLSFPYLAGRLVDAASGRGGDVDRTAGLMVGVIAAQAAVSYFHALSFAVVGQRCLVGLRRDVYARLLTLPMAFHTRRRVGELASRLSADLGQIEDAIISVLPQFLRQAVLLLGGVTLVAATSLRLTGILLASLPVLTALAVAFGRRTRRLAREAQDRLADTATVVEETLQGIVNVKAFANEGHELRRYEEGLGRFLSATLRGARLRAAFIAFIVSALFGSVVLVLWSGARLLRAGDITFGELTRFLLYTTFVAGAMGHFADLYASIQRAVGATQRVRELLREPGELDVASLGAPVPALPRLRGEVVFDDVRFAYPSRPGMEVLHGISLRVAPGEKVALVGPSGAGKSTLIALLLRLHDPVSGRLLVDGRDAREYPLAALRGQMSMVPQEVLLFGGTIAENIAYGRPGATQAEVEDAARKANAHGFIESFPEGYRTTVGDRGVRLSGGQRQRIAIARAILRDPAVLVLDEATSALDSESEGLIQAALETLMRGRTTFLVAHRLATVRHADRIVVVSGGRVVESGTHAELERREGGVYRRLAALQFRDAGGDADGQNPVERGGDGLRQEEP